MTATTTDPRGWAGHRRGCADPDPEPQSGFLSRDKWMLRNTVSKLRASHGRPWRGGETAGRDF